MVDIREGGEGQMEVDALADNYEGGGRQSSDLEDRGASLKTSEEGMVVSVPFFEDPHWVGGGHQVLNEFDSRNSNFQRSLDHHTGGR
mmetsp:Transcript_52314/g.111169  ORF Transcript_52314/g.111169 Transcript_52314/m.111169 type:complete len:87 (-) Transcript_52314:56-316(-)